MTEGLLISQLVSSRICHDLISPIGAIGNGLELLRGPGDGAEEMALIGECAETASLTLRFLRLAFGARDMAEPGEADRIPQLATAYFEKRRIDLHWRNGPDLPPFVVMRLLLLLALTAADALPRGGALTLKTAEAAPLRAEWRASGRVRITDRLRMLLSARPEPAAFTPGEAHILLLRLAVEQYGVRLTQDGAGGFALQ